MENSGQHFHHLNLGGFAAISKEQSLGTTGKAFFGKNIGLTGAEISLNVLEAQQAIPFLHSHNQNEEIYLVISGSGHFSVDNQQFPVMAGSVLRIAPAGVRGWIAGNQGLTFACIQVKAHSLEQATLTDGKIVAGQVNWQG